MADSLTPNFDHIYACQSVSASEDEKKNEKTTDVIRRKVAYVYSSEYVEQCSSLPKVASRVNVDLYAIHVTSEFLSLYQHGVVRTDERRFVCNTCNNSFRHATGERTVACSTCKDFNRHQLYVNMKFFTQASLVHCLIESFGLLNHMSIICPTLAKRRDLETFHTAEYLDFLYRISRPGVEDDDHAFKDADAYGLSYDCPAYPHIYESASLIAGASIAAADSILTGEADTVINWNGGWHHAKRDEAAGFCYINDIVLCILRLHQKYQRVLYIDFDLHHGDGVQDAFSGTDKVMTVSMHKCCPGFYPGTGNVDNLGVGRGKFHTVNVPLLDGIDSDTYVDVFKRVMDAVVPVFNPQVVVCQCGVDGLVGDPHGYYNLTPRAFVECLQVVLLLDLPLVLLGGGGYNFPNAARCWTELTAAAVGQTLNKDIPDHQYFTKYGPDFDLEISPGNMPNQNTPGYVDIVVTAIQSHMSIISERHS